jgi:hypothetical protein
MKEIYQVCPICKKENTCYKIGTKVFCKKGSKISEVLTNAFNKVINKQYGNN